MTVTTLLPRDEFRAVLRRHAAGVVVITVPGAGFTATSFTSVSLDPPLILFCVDHRASAHPAVLAAGHAAVHLLGAGDEEVARTFAASGTDRFAGPLRWHCGPYGVPLLDGVTNRLLCRVVKRFDAGDHTVVLAEAAEGHSDGDHGALVYHQGNFLRHEPDHH